MASCFGSCKKDDTSTAPEVKEPKAGSSWTYKQTEYLEDGTVKGTATLSLAASDTNIWNGTGLVLRETNYRIPVFLIQKRADGWWWAPLPNTTPSLWFKTTAAVNDQYLLSITDGSTDTAKVVDLNKTVTVAGGTFPCQYVESYDGGRKEDEWYFSANDGLLLQQVTYDQKTSGTGIWVKRKTELTSFKQ